VLDLATRLLGEPLVGDLLERRANGRSALWFWWQVSAALLATIGRDALAYPVVAIASIGIGGSLPELYLRLFGGGRLATTLNGWYPALIGWLLRSERDGLRHFVYRMHVGAWTFTALYCGFVATFACAATAIRPRQRVMIVTLIAIAHLAVTFQYFESTALRWMGEPANWIRQYDLLWQAVLTFVDVPASVVVGGVCGYRLRNSITQNVASPQK
jgi:hypothetical protein